MGAPARTGRNQRRADLCDLRHCSLRKTRHDPAAQTPGQVASIPKFLTAGDRVSGDGFGKADETCLVDVENRVVAIPRFDIGAIAEMRADGEMAQVCFINGDMITGVPDFGDCRLTTIFGPMDLPVAHL